MVFPRVEHLEDFASISTTARLGVAVVLRECRAVDEERGAPLFQEGA
jgi:hypothetical protein